MYENDKEQIEEYETPSILELGDGAELTLGRPWFDCIDFSGQTRPCQ